LSAQLGVVENALVAKFFATFATGAPPAHRSVCTRSSLDWKSLTLRDLSFRGQRMDIRIERDAAGVARLTRHAH